MKIQTYLPLFTGFYGSHWEDPYLGDYTAKEVEYLDWNAYFNEIAESLCVAIEEHLQEIFQSKEISVLFEKVVFPKFYNYKNDSINCAIELPKEELKELYKYLFCNQNEFSDYLKERYTSRSGFISHYSNELFVWLNEYYLDIETNPHILGTILDFVLINEGINEDNLMYCGEHVYIYLLENYVE